jgi:hypothetical protein
MTLTAHVGLDFPRSGSLWWSSERSDFPQTDEAKKKAGHTHFEKWKLPQRLFAAGGPFFPYHKVREASYYLFASSLNNKKRRARLKVSRAIFLCSGSIDQSSRAAHIIDLTTFFFCQLRKNGIEASKADTG